MQTPLEEIPDGIKKVESLLVTDDYVSNRKVCVVDTGYNLGHPDLPDENVVTGSTGIAGAAWNEDGHGHGTHCAGTIAAIGGNNRGVVGVVRSGLMKMHIVRVFNGAGNWTWGSDLLTAVSSLLYLPKQECYQPPNRCRIFFLGRSMCGSRI